jgi:hypothetical protein
VDLWRTFEFLRHGCCWRLVYEEIDSLDHCVCSYGAVLGRDCESSRPLSDVLVINDNCLWTNGSWKNKNAELDHIERKILEIYQHWLWIK